MNLPIFKTARLILKPVELSDVPSYEKHFVDYEVISELAAHVPWPYPTNGVRDFLESMILPRQGKDSWMWGIFLKENPGEMIGGIQLWREGKPENRGFWLGRKFWGKGIMTEAVEPVMEYAFNKLGFEKLVFANAVGNIRSRRIKEKTGARLRRVAPAKFVNPAYTEHEIWELTKEEWTSRTALKLVPFDRQGRVVEPEIPLSPLAEDVCAQMAPLFQVNGYVPPWIGYLALLKGQWVGTCAFKSPPSEGRVEIAYFTFPEFENRGIATQMAKGLIEASAKADSSVKVFAQTLPVENSSNHILKKLGFKFMGMVFHPEDGNVWEWSL
jgi:[ribosomal protein S5]-alanine N-acetyltransferase